MSLARPLLLTLMGLALLVGCPSTGPSASDDDDFATADDDDATAADDDDTAPDDDDTAPDDDDSGAPDPNCPVTISGTIDADGPANLTTMWLAAFRPEEVDKTGFPQGGSGVENFVIDDVTLPYDYQLCGAPEGTVVLAFLFDPAEDMCVPGTLFGARVVDAGLDPAEGQDLTLDRVLTEEDCKRNGDPPPE
jgi:hypothetical protein